MSSKLEELFFKFVSEQFSVDIENVKDNWKQFISHEKNKLNKDEVFHCIYEYSRNPRKGEVCGKKIKSGEYCSSHKKREKKIEKESDNESSNESEKETKKVKEKEKVKVIEKEKVKEKVEPVDQTLVVRLYPKIGKYIHPLTRLAFFSKEHKVVYAKLSLLDDTIIPLSDKDIETCKRYLFRYDTTLYKT
jgi:hypothetical protein